MSTKADKLRDKYIALLQVCVDAHDPEWAHSEADEKLCDLLTELGYGEVVELYKKVEKWYA